MPSHAVVMFSDSDGVLILDYSDINVTETDKIRAKGQFMKIELIVYYYSTGFSLQFYMFFKSVG